MDITNLTNNIAEHLKNLEAFTSTPGKGVTRLPYTKEAKDASDYLVKEMKKIGLKTRIDVSGSVIGRIEGESKETIMIGSHYDSVQSGGSYDGIAGVVSALEVGRILSLSGKRPKYSIEIIATNDEEGVRFKSGIFSCKVLLGNVSIDDLKNAIDDDGISIYEAMESYGLNPDEIQADIRNDIRAFIEVHIEQGPILEGNNKDIGIVNTIVGIKRAVVTVNGRADHVGTTPMGMRKDAMEVATKVISKIGNTAREFSQAVATVGNMTIEPNVINIIPSKVTFTVDFRGSTREIIDLQYNRMIENLNGFTLEHGLTYGVVDTLDLDPVHMSNGFAKVIEESCIKRDYSFMHMVSGAGHDAMIMGEVIDTSMIFVPSIGGRSHCVEEFSEYEDIAKATLLTLDLVNYICGTIF